MKTLGASQNVNATIFDMEVLPYGQLLCLGTTRSAIRVIVSTLGCVANRPTQTMTACTESIPTTQVHSHQPLAVCSFRNSKCFGPGTLSSTTREYLLQPVAAGAGLDLKIKILTGQEGESMDPCTKEVVTPLRTEHRSIWWCEPHFVSLNERGRRVGTELCPCFATRLLV